jgi:hypothetical protein
MRGPPVQARLVEVDHSYLSVDLGVAEPAGSADADFVPPAEESPNPFPHMPADSFIGSACIAEAEVLGPSRQKSVKPGE